jgi:hypothetical protein
MATTRYLRLAGQWAKITRDTKARKWTFALGYEGEHLPRHVHVNDFKHVGLTWYDADLHARYLIVNRSITAGR